MDPSQYLPLLFQALGVSFLASFLLGSAEGQHSEELSQEQGWVVGPEESELLSHQEKSMRELFEQLLADQERVKRADILKLL